MVDWSRNSRRHRVPSPVSSLLVVERADLGEPEDGAGRAGRLGADRVPGRAGPRPGGRAGCRRAARPSGEVSAASQASTTPVRPRGRCADAGAGEAVADGGVDEDVEGVGDEGGGTARAAAPAGSSARATGGVAADERLDAPRRRDPARRAASGRAAAGSARSRVGQHAPAGGEVVGQRGDRPQVRDRGAVAQLVGGVVEFGRVDGRPRAPPTAAARARRAESGRGRSGRARGRAPARRRGRQQQRDLGGRAGMDARRGRRAGTANGCGRAERSARLRPVAGRSPSSAHSITPRPGDHSACTTNTPPPYVRPARRPGTGPVGRVGRRESPPESARQSLRTGARVARTYSRRRYELAPSCTRALARESRRTDARSARSARVAGPCGSEAEAGAELLGDEVEVLVGWRAM